MTLKQLQVAVLDEVLALTEEPVIDPYESRKIIVELFGEVDGQEDDTPEQHSGERPESV
jgi:hypothetical protein